MTRTEKQDEFRSKMLQALEEAQTEALSGDLESLCIVGRRHNGQHVALLVQEYGADLCSLFGFFIMLVARTVQADSDVVGTEKDRVLRVVQ